MNQDINDRRAFRHPPMSKREMEWRGWHQLDVILVTGDAFIDHPSFEIAVLGRVLETMGLKVGFISQPDWNDVREFTQLGQPRLFFGITAGKNDSMVANYRPTKRPRKIDFFSPGRLPGLRPDRSSQVYAELCKRAYPDVPVVLTGVEATSRRHAHYDFWDDNLRPGLLVDCVADLLIYGHPERAITQVAKILARNGGIEECRNIRGICYKIEGNEKDNHTMLPPESLALPSWEEMQTSKKSFVEMFRAIRANSDYYARVKPLVQEYADCVVVQTPPQRPLSTNEMDRIYALQYSRTPHPKYREAGPIPSFETVKYGLITHHGCFGDCSFCSHREHEGRYISQRSKASILEEATLVAGLRYFRGWISNVGGPMANMYGMGCTLSEDDRMDCTRHSCLSPEKCPNLNTSHAEYLDLLRSVRYVDGVERSYISSPLRIDLLDDDPLADEFMEEIMRYFLPGHLKMPFEHVSSGVTSRLHKYTGEQIASFIDRFNRLKSMSGLDDLFITPYFISAHPGSRLEDAIDVALFIKQYDLPECQIQDFVPMPGSASACMYFAGIDPDTEEPVYRPLAYRERKLQRSLFQFYKPQNERYVYDALREANRLDLVGPDPECLLCAEPAWTPFE